MPQNNNRTTRPRIYSVPFGVDLCQATVSYILHEVGIDPLALSRAIILLPNNRAVKTMTEAFVREAEPGLLLPHMVAVGDLALDEALGPILDPLTDEKPISTAITTSSRIAMLTKLVLANRPKGQFVSVAEAIRLARKLSDMIDELEIEQVSFEMIAELRIETDLAEHWQSCYRQVEAILPAYRAELARRTLLGPAERRNLLLGRFEQRLSHSPPDFPVYAVGITTAAKAVAKLLRRISRLEQGTVILPGVDLDMPQQDWDALLPADVDEGDARHHRNIEVHPQFHLRLLLDRMGVVRDEVERFVPRDMSNKGSVITDIFCLPEQSASWRDLPPSRKQLPHVNVIEASDSATEARAISVAVRRALEEPGKRIAVITPDRQLALRVAAQLRRWGIVVDDSAGRSLFQTPPGTLILALVDAIASRFSATSVLEIAKHPLTGFGENRLAWLEHARSLDLHLRGPTGGVGLTWISKRLVQDAAEDEGLNRWWLAYSAQLLKLEPALPTGLGSIFAAIREVGTELTAGQIWKGSAGRELATLWEEIAGSDLAELTTDDRSAISAIIVELLSGAVVRPPYGGHPRVAIYGLLEARMQQADLLICGGLNEATWPQIAQPDPWLAPAIRRHLGLATLDRNIGLSAHDLATALGGKQVILTRAMRDSSGPTVASRFLLRIKALLGNQLQTDATLPVLARALDAATFKPGFAERPQPLPSAQQRRVTLSVTDFDQLKSDPYSFYAKRILRLKPLDTIDAQPSHAWRGTLVHDILEAWFKSDACDPEKLLTRAAELLKDDTLDPVLRALWQPRISEGLQWIARETQRMRDEEGRQLLIAEEDGEIELLGTRIRGRADRIDAGKDGSLIIIDYKTGIPPKPKQINAGFALQLGLVGLMAERGAIKGVNGCASGFEYWSLAKNKDRAFGFVSVVKETQIAENFISFVKVQAEDALSRWILGVEPFHAKLHPEYSNHGDYDQLMRLQEWNGRQAVVGSDAP
ncbi:MAG: double-strand break repair protein AddB [Sphingomonadaceae bacterium]|nr:double-strand break repair protein AddB [Sphingomonadaceae bacterium]